MWSDPVIKLRSDPGPVFKSWTDSDPDPVFKSWTNSNPDLVKTSRVKNHLKLNIYCCSNINRSNIVA